MKKIVLAYSGGLDTSCCVKWLQDKGFEVICFSANLGSEFLPSQLRNMSKRSGVKKIYVQDLRKEFARDYILASLKAGAVYQGKYLLSTALGRPLIARHLVEVARKEKASYIAHGCTAKGNDQVRLEIAVKALNPKLKIIAPLRQWDLTSRDSEIAYALKNNLPIKATREKIYSIDKNIWGVSIEAGFLEDLENEPKKDAFIMTRSWQEAPAVAEQISIGFEKGCPISLGGKRMELTSLIEKLNKIGGRHCIGRTDIVEDRTVGIKSREIYEAPAAWILHLAHKEIESVTLDKETLAFKDMVSLKYAQLIYQGLWFSKIKSALDAFIDKTQDKVSGSIGLKLYKGNVIVSKRRCPHSLYKKELATYGEGDRFNRDWAEGFINIWGMPHRGQNKK
ncbi:MAG: argininosuccinate synthase [Candidatus Omnitrophica bacterium]|nr:argininosuccinate synthase [Candidatus Omnitrophota bacterium]MDD5429567.1 argininosuccinate synthase [Candidatus Omnitrophota bacterium]